MNKTKVIVGMGIALSLFTAANAMAGVLAFDKCDQSNNACGIFYYMNEMSSGVKITTSTDKADTCDVHTEAASHRDANGWSFPDLDKCTGTMVTSISVTPIDNSLVGSNIAVQGGSVACTGAGLNTAFKPGKTPSYFTAIVKDASGKMTCTVVADSAKSK